MAGRTIRTPTFFPSVSSVKTNLRPSEYVRILAALGEPRVLVSAYDVAAADERERFAMVGALQEVGANGCSILLDSGNYERFWHRDERWTVTSYADVIASWPPTLAFSFDHLEPANDPIRAAEDVIAGVLRDQACSTNATICPIIHARDPGALTATVRTVAERLQPILLAVPERELGDGLLERADTVHHLRSVLDGVAPATALHVLGTGSPIALLIYAKAGAQSFDGLEWCHTCVDPDAVHLHHFQHRELVRTITPEITADLPYAIGTLAHNLLFFRSWMRRITEALATGTAAALLASALPQTRRDEVLAWFEAR